MCIIVWEILFTQHVFTVNTQVGLVLRFRNLNDIDFRDKVHKHDQLDVNGCLYAHSVVVQEEGSLVHPSLGFFSHIQMFL